MIEGLKMSKDEFAGLIAEVTRAAAGQPVDAALARALNDRFPASGAKFQAIRAACERAIADGWMCDRDQGGIKFGRVIKDIDGFSVDVVQMKDVVGPHHRHPNGEIDMVMPLDPAAKFDGHGAGWVAYGPNSAHKPTVSDGAALVLYLLPGGAIEFTRG
jgi:hypothetical protein